ncbi:hypothetical protein AAE478_001917 [Parahypoxylon ruwenzoriense]
MESNKHLSPSKAHGLYNIWSPLFQPLITESTYHWGLFASGDSPPSGFLLHATDTGREALDLYQEVRRVSDPRKSGTLVVVLKIANSPGLDALNRCASSIRLMDPRYLPQGESRWTCRVWIKEVLNSLHRNRYIHLPSGVDTIEQWCEYAADRHIQYKGMARVINDLTWMTTGSPSRATLSDADARGDDGRYYGSSPMVIDSTGGRYYGPSPMVTEI